jgi:hypothetical protein
MRLSHRQCGFLGDGTEPILLGSGFQICPVFHSTIQFATQVLGDVVNCVRGDWLRGGTGVIIAAALLLFLLQPRIRATFA